MEEANRKRRESLEAHFKIYQRSARLKKLPFEFSEEEFKSLVIQPCYYCNIVDEKGFNEKPDCACEEKTPAGIRINVEEPKSTAKDKVLTSFNGVDRMNQATGYVPSNSVSCCAMCNWMKGSLDSATFIKRIQHIHSFTKNNGNTRHPECFPDAKCISYASYRSRAEKKELEFVITNDEYKSIIQQDCNLCGKKTTETNINGVDRIDNTVGYTVENCKACCKECNHMKNNFALDVLMGKIERIHANWKERELPILQAQIYSIVQIAEKMTKEEIKKEKENKKQKTLQKHRDYLESIGVLEIK
jgi:hypothetical protein